MGRNTEMKMSTDMLPELIGEKLKGELWGTKEHGEAMKAGQVTKVIEPAGGKKFDAGKSPVVRGFMRYFPRAILAVADVSAYGAKKYDVSFDEKSWAGVPDGEGRPSASA